MLWYHAGQTIIYSVVAFINEKESKYVWNILLDPYIANAGSDCPPTVVLA